MTPPRTHMRRDCPRCRVALEEREHEVPGFNVHADHCPKCEGVFLDENELKRLTGQKNLNKLITEYLGVDVGSDLICPACGGLMDDEHFTGEAETVTIDVCTTCRGVWLDAGELDGLAALDDKAFKDIPMEKRAERFDHDMALEQSARGGNAFARALGSFVRTMKRGARRFK